MRPIKLTMTAFGPYKDTEVVDFRELKDMNLFLITGPTGAGKTTIFDAISFAIYGEASGNMRSAESLRSHFAENEVLTEVTLEFDLKGNTYHIHRIPKQNKPKARGEGLTEQKPDATLTIFEGETKTVVAGIKSVNEKIETLLGINAEQFKQIMMIPQGEFQKLLTAGSEERQRVLQQLFDTGIYNILQARLDLQAKTLEAGIKSSRFMRDGHLSRIECPEDSPLRGLIQADEKQLGEIMALTQVQIEGDQRQKLQLEETLRDWGKKIEKEIEAREKARESNEKLALKEKTQGEWLEKEQQKEPMMGLERQVEEAEKAWGLGPLEENERVRKIDFESKKNEVEQIAAKIESAKHQAKVAEEVYLKESVPEKMKQRELFIEELSRLRSYEEKVAQIESVSASIREMESKCLQIERDRQSCTETVTTANKDIQVLREKVAQAKDAEVKAAVMGETLNKATEEGKKIKKLLDLQGTIMAEVAQYGEKAQGVKVLFEKVQTSTQNYKASKLNWLMNQAAVLAKDLKEGDACPVCGSTHHVALAAYSERTVSEDELNALELALKKDEEDYNRENRNLGICENQLQSSRAIRAQGLQELTLIASLNGENINIENRTEEEISTYLETLIDGRRKEVLQLKKELALLEQTASAHEGLLTEINRLSERAQNAEKQMEALTQEFVQKNNKLAEARTTLKLIFEVVPETIRNISKLKEAIGAQEKLQKAWADRLNEALKGHEEAQAALLRLNAHQDQLNKDLMTAGSNFEQASLAFVEGVKASKFENREAYIKAKLPHETLADYRKQIETYNKDLHGLKLRLDELMRDTEGLKPVELETFETQLAQLRTENSEWTNLKSATESRIENNEKILSAVGTIQQEIGEKEAQYQVMGNLAKVAKGENPARITFERYVLAAFLEDIIVAANIRLSQMTSGRYKLSRTEELQRSNAKGGLELEVYDNYTGKSRHVKTLSGGEGFKASLSMALGLADVVQAYAGGVQLDTMFIDEGFGTLDGESLDSAISCLIDLQKTGRLVGIISHVQELKERMDARLEVLSTSLGSETRFVVN